jgi:hypothetical protein
MGEAVGEGRIEDHLPPIGDVKYAVLGDAEPGRGLHPAISREDPEGRDHGAERHHAAREEMHPFRHAVPSEQHDAEKARFEKESGQHFVRHQGADDIATAARQFAPIGAELVGEDDAGDHAHAEGDGEDLGPMKRDVAVDRLSGAKPQRLEHDEPGSEPDGEGRKENVERDGEGELDARQQ